jgi:hypothetical protein
VCCVSYGSGGADLQANIGNFLGAKVKQGETLLFMC